MASLCELYRLFSEDTISSVISYLPSYEHLTEQGRASLAKADILIEQVLDLAPAIDLKGVAAGARRHFVPLVAAGFLWPFAGPAHPKNAPTSFLPSGPYGNEVGDSYLNRLVLAGTDPADAFVRYSSLDVRKIVNLDRLFEIWIDRQRSRDEISGFRIADEIASHFRTEALFRTPHHPNIRIFRSLATQLFEKLHVSPADTDRMTRSLSVSPFPYDALPIHPAVKDHFGLEFSRGDDRYPFLNEGSFTFHEYVSRYMTYEYNESLAEGIAISEHGAPDRAEKLLMAGLLKSPTSAIGYLCLARVRLKQDRLEDAVSMARQAAIYGEDNPYVFSLLGDLLGRTTDIGGAEFALRRAIDLRPYQPYFADQLMAILRRDGRLEDIKPVIENIIHWLPYYDPPYHWLSSLLYQLNDTAAAEAAALKGQALRTAVLQRDEERAVA